MDTRLTELLSVLPAVDALNSYVRSEAARRGWTGSNLKRIVYHYKREALREATQHAIAKHRLICVETQCIQCGGTCRYVDSGGYRWPHCRRCSSTGTVKLQFCESSIDGGFVWHSPLRDSYSFLPNNWSEMPVWPVVNWRVHTPGTDLDIDTVAGHLLAIEAFWSHTPPRPYYVDDLGEFDPHATYALYAGESDPAVCVICRGAVVVAEDKYPHRLGVSTGRVSWTAHICDDCEAAAKGTTQHFEAAARNFPDALWTPNLRRWNACHPEAAA